MIRQRGPLALPREEGISSFDLEDLAIMAQGISNLLRLMSDHIPHHQAIVGDARLLRGNFEDIATIAWSASHLVDGLQKELAAMATRELRAEVRENAA